jgi:hypothetical protein
MSCQKKGTTPGTWNIMFGLALATKQLFFIKIMLIFCKLAPKIRNFNQNYTTKTKISS